MSLEFEVLLNVKYDHVNWMLLLCRLSGKSPISSMKSQLLFAFSKHPFLLLVAPVKLPALCPNSSDSRIFGLREVSFICVIGNEYRFENR